MWLYVRVLLYWCLFYYYVACTRNHTLVINPTYVSPSSLLISNVFPVNLTVVTLNQSQILIVNTCDVLLLHVNQSRSGNNSKSSSSSSSSGNPRISSSLQSSSLVPSSSLLSSSQVSSSLYSSSQVSSSLSSSLHSSSQASSSISSSLSSSLLSSSQVSSSLSSSLHSSSQLSSSQVSSSLSSSLHSSSSSSSSLPVTLLSPFSVIPNPPITVPNCPPINATLSGGPGAGDYAILPVPKQPNAPFYGYDGGYVDPDLIPPSYYTDTNDVFGEQLWQWEQTFRPICQSTCACLQGELANSNPFGVTMQIWNATNLPGGGWLNPALVNAHSNVLHCFEAGVYILNTSFPAPFNYSWYAGCPNSLIYVSGPTKVAFVDYQNGCNQCPYANHYMLNGITIDLSRATINDPFQFGTPSAFGQFANYVVMFNNTIRNLPTNLVCNGYVGVISDVAGPFRIYDNVFFNLCYAVSAFGNSEYIGRNWFLNVGNSLNSITSGYFHYITWNMFIMNGFNNNLGTYFQILNPQGMMCGAWIANNFISLGAGLSGNPNSAPFYLVSNAGESTPYNNCPASEFMCVYFTNNTIITNSTATSQATVYSSDLGDQWAWVLKNNTFVNLGQHIKCPSQYTLSYPWGLETLVGSLFANNSYMQAAGGPPCWLPPGYVMPAYSAGGQACIAQYNVCDYLAPLTVTQVNTIGPEYFYVANDTGPVNWELVFSGPSFGTRVPNGEAYPYNGCCAPGGNQGPCCTPYVPATGRAYPCQYGNTQYWLDVEMEAQLMSFDTAREQIHTIKRQQSLARTDPLTRLFTVTQ